MLKQNNVCISSSFLQNTKNNKYVLAPNLLFFLILRHIAVCLFPIYPIAFIILQLNTLKIFIFCVMQKWCHLLYKTSICFIINVDITTSYSKASRIRFIVFNTNKSSIHELKGLLMIFQDTLKMKCKKQISSKYQNASRIRFFCVFLNSFRG